MELETSFKDKVHVVLYKGVTLTKGNLAIELARDLKCSFYNADENIQHLSFDCPLARFIWCIIYVSFNITPPTSFYHIFTHWLGATKIGVRKLFGVGFVPSIGLYGCLGIMWFFIISLYCPICRCFSERHIG
jgi:hypothetical protein